MAKQYIPNVDTKNNPAKTDEAVRLAHIRLTQLGNHLMKLGAQTEQVHKLVSDPLSLEKVLAAIPSYDLNYTGNSAQIAGLQGSIPPDVSGGFTNSFDQSSITWSWSGLLDYPAHLWNQPQRYNPIPGGSAGSTGLAASTKYFFYPYWDLVSGFVKFAFDPLLVIGTGPANALSGPSFVAAQEMYGDGHKALSSGSMSQTTAAPGGTGGGTGGGSGGGGGGGGGGGCPRADMKVRHVAHGLMPVGRCKFGDLIYDRNGLKTIVKSVELFKSKVGIQIGCSNDEWMTSTGSHLYPLPDEFLHRADDITLQDILLDDRDRPIQVLAIRAVLQESTYVKIETDSHTFCCGGDRAGILNHNVQKL